MLFFFRCFGFFVFEFGFTLKSAWSEHFALVASQLVHCIFFASAVGPKHRLFMELNPSNLATSTCFVE